MASVPAVIIGGYAVAVGVQNNATCAFDLIKEQDAFIPWIIAVGILWAIWKYTPGDAGTIAKDIIALGILAFIITQFSTVNGYVTDIWAAIPGTSNIGG